jgi:hypothetical protein
MKIISKIENITIIKLPNKQLPDYVNVLLTITAILFQKVL